jgi:hypothetical protein
MSAGATVTEADILNDVIAPDNPELTAEAAQALLRLHFSDSARARIRELLDANNRGEITADERSELDKYLRVGQLFDLLQAKARLSLRKPSGP